MAFQKEGFGQVSQVNLNPTLSRRRFIEMAGKGATYGLIAAASKEAVDLGRQAHSQEGIRIFPDRNYALTTQYPTENFGIEMYNLSERFETTIAHRAANTIKGVRDAARAGFTYADGDILKSNGLYVSHTPEDEIFGKKPKLFNRPLFGLNTDNKKARILHNPPTLEKIAHTAATESIGLSWELKHGKFVHTDLHTIIRIQRAYATSLMLHSNDPDIITAGKNIDENYTANGDSIKWLIVPSLGTWDEAIKFSQGRLHTGILTNWQSARDRSEKLKDSYVVLGDIDTPEAVKKATELDVVNGIMGEQGILSPFLKAA